MRTSSILLGALLSGGLASGQESTTSGLASFESLSRDSVPANRIYAGTYSAATGQMIPGTQVPGTQSGSAAECGLGLIYNNTIPFTEFVDFFHNAAAGNTIIDEGRIPSISGGGPADVYTVNTISLGYVTNQPSLDVELSFWTLGDTCDTLASLGTPLAQFTLTGLPGSTGGEMTILVDIDLGGMAFDILGDANGIAGDGDWDRFGWAFKVLGQDPNLGHVTGPLLAGAPDVCPRGRGLFGAMGGFGGFPAAGCDGDIEGLATGLGTSNSFRRAVDGPATPGCFDFGGTPADPLASFYLKVSSSLANDECESAIGLGSAIGTGLANANTCCATPSNDLVACGPLNISRDVWYEWVAPQTGIFEFDTFGSNFDTFLQVYSGSCGALVCEGFNDDSGSLQSLVSVSVTSGTSYFIRIGGFNLAACGDAVLNIEEDPCSFAVDDVFGPNDTCLEATLAVGGTFEDFVFNGNDDFYVGVVCAGDTVTVDALFEHSEGDVDIQIFDGTFGCPGTLVQNGFSTTDNEQVSFTNSSSEAVRYFVRVALFGAADCNFYTLLINGDCSIGTRYCSDGVQNDNSTGDIGRLSVWGSTDVGQDDLNLLATGLPPSSPGFFIWSPNQGFINLPMVGVSDGFLCLGSNLGRFSGQNGAQGMVQSSGLGGTFQLFGIDTTDLPQSSMVGGLAVFPGLTANFQAWYRDGAGVIGNNFTEACTFLYQ